MFKDRKDAGMKLAQAMGNYRGEDVIVFALPRGGVVLGVEIAKELSAPLDLIITKKIGHPRNEEYAICAIAEDGSPVCNEAEVKRVDPGWFEDTVRAGRMEIKKRREKYMGDVLRQPLDGKTAIIVDDGIATGLTMMAAIEEVKGRKPQRIIVAIPVVPSETAQRLKAMADDLVALNIDQHYMGAVGAYYHDFRQVSDKEVVDILESIKKKEA